MEESSQNIEKNWLIRSSARIMGPYTLEEVTKLLVGKHISIIDEIRQPLVRWSYIRENRVFLDLVKDLRQEQDNAIENTMTMTATLSNQSLTKTDAINLHIDDLTPPPVLTADSFNRRSSDVKDITSLVTEVTSKPHGHGGKSYGSTKDERLHQRIEKKAQRLKAIISGLSVAILLVLGVSYFSKGRQKVSDYEDLTTLALKYKNIGLYDKALDSYKRIQLTREPDFELQFQMAPLLISEDRQSLLGRRILEKAILSEGRSREDLIDSHIGIALTFIQEGDLKEAENYLQKAMTYEPNNATVMTNLAIIQLKKGNYALGARELDALGKKNPRSNLLLGLRAIAWIEASRTMIDVSALNSLLANINAVLGHPTYLGQELSLLAIDITHLLKDTTGQELAVKNFLNQVPFRSSQYLRSYRVDWRMLQWDYIEKYCADAFSDPKLSALQKGARAICLMEVNRDEDASRLITEALSELPHDPSLVAVEANYFMKISRSAEALTLLKLPEVQALPLTQQLTGTLCMQLGKVDCSKSAYKSILEHDKENIYALYGLSWVALEKSQHKQSYELAKAGLEIEAGYLPLIDLRDRLDSQ